MLIGGMRRSRLFAALLLMLLLAAVIHLGLLATPVSARPRAASHNIYLPLVSSIPPPPPPAAPAPPTPEQQMLSEINAARASYGLAALRDAYQLNSAARRHSADMANVLLNVQHRGSDGTSAGDRITASGYQFATYGEAVGGSSDYGISMMVEAWLNSPSHRDLLLSGTYVDAGIGYARSNINGWCYWTVDLGLPR